MVRPVDERGIGEDLRQEGTIESATKLVSMLAEVKRGGVLEELKEMKEVAGERIVLTADQVVTHPTLGILEKPESREEAEQFMMAYANVSSVTTVGSVMLTEWPSMKTSLKTFTSTVRFDGEGLKKDMEKGKEEGGKTLLDRLLEADAPVYDCAGGLMIENPLVKEFIVGVDGTEDSVLGLSRRSVLECYRDLKEK
ncbi:hypothetical protein TrVE_jg13508 [Triparma verrucosa]|uniref:Uncharacterized protein n=1 Tax=Triparma verrucosa TaxID=1606542 RepID=A0A9W7CCM6_9STRA|nr:hypothetical protein TrVE_jg13508 [Triparma verrucosa]